MSEKIISVQESVPLARIANRLFDEALIDPETGWLSDAAEGGVFGDRERGVIYADVVDVGHLAAIVLDIIKEERNA